MQQSIVEVKNIWVEDLFKWFHQHIGDSCGDGSACIVCENYKEVSNWFIEWWKTNILPVLNDRGYKLHEFYHDKDEYDDFVTYHDSNENFMFSNTIPRLDDHDYIFIVTEDCYFASGNNDTKVLKYRG